MLARSIPSSNFPVIIRHFPHWKARLRYITTSLFVLLLAVHIHAEEFVFHHENVLGTSPSERLIRLNPGAAGDDRMVLSLTFPSGSLEAES
jgi:hypothetical protein